MTISGGDAGDLNGLHEFIGSRPDVTAGLRSVPPPPGSQGSAADVLTVAMGTGGAVTVAVPTIRDWVASLSTRLRIDVGGRKLELDTRNVDSVLPQVEELLKVVLAEADADAQSDADAPSDDES